MTRTSRPPTQRLRGAALCGAALLGLVPVQAAGARRPERRAPESAPVEGEAAQEAYKHFSFGDKFYKQGQLREAENAFRRALALQPGYTEANYMLAVVYRELKDYRAALHEASEALSANPLFTEAHNLMGLIHAEMGDYDAALKEFQIVLGDVSFPTPEVAHFNIGKVFWERHACPEAVLHFRRALELNPSWGRAWYLLGDCQEAMSQRTQARESYLKAIDLLPDEVGPAYRLGLLCFQEGNFPCAQQWFEKVLTKAPGSEQAAGAREYLRQMQFR